MGLWWLNGSKWVLYYMFFLFPKDRLLYSRAKKSIDISVTVSS